MEEEYSEEEIAEAERARDLIEEIIGRCNDSGIEYKDYSDEEEIGVVDVNLDIFLPAGRKKREIGLWDVEDLEAFASIEFEKFVMVGNYSAICHYENGRIEALVSIIDDNRNSQILMQIRLLKSLGVEVRKMSSFEPHTLGDQDSSHKPKITVSPLSHELRTLTRAPKGFSVSIIIEDSRIKTHSEAIKSLEKITHSLFFEIEVKNGIAPTLLRTKQRRYKHRSLASIEGADYPKYEYDHGPISLYWYARSATNMPLLQFLAYYQTIEFYFPVYSRYEINKRLKGILKDPSFKIDRESDLSRITSLVTNKSGGYGSEREQLRATLRECIDINELEEFITESEERLEFFGSKQKGITGHSLNLKNRSTDMINQVSDRVYDIRCKVVHVKSDDGDTEIELLLPYTEESEKLIFDIDLVQFLAQKVLICSSTSARL